MSKIYQCHHHTDHSSSQPLEATLRSTLQNNETEKQQNLVTAALHCAAVHSPLLACFGLAAQHQHPP